MADIIEKEFDASDGVYRSAFPAYRVFIYGQEVTQDVIEVRVNHSGGSLERTPGGCSFTLVNPNNKYIITHNDMRDIGKAIFGLKDTTDASFSLFMKDNPNASVDEMMFESFSSDQGKTGMSDVDWESSYVAPQPDNVFSAAYVPTDIKRTVVESKMSWRVMLDKSQTSTVVKYDKELIFDYPMQEGDCIFHPNDPVRVVFRDPFDPRIWYWMFTGFMDSFTENKGVNKESLVTITCTDVSKMARYSFVNVDTGILDPDLAQKLQTAANVSTTGLNLYQEFFAGLNIFEILESLFFGSASLIGFQKESTRQLIKDWSSEEIAQYLTTNVPNYTSEIANKINEIKSKYRGTYAEESALRGIVAELEVQRVEKAVTGLLVQGRNIGAISSPHGIRFKRCNDAMGLTVYYIDEPNADSPFKEIGTRLGSLKEWNDLVYHRVVPQDWYRMSKDDNPGAPPKSLADSWSSENVVHGLITEICTNLDKFPVGCGRVFYLTQAKLTEDLGTNVIDRGLATNGIVTHSICLDRLTLLYDMADRTDFFRFYATPRGDLVFELAFYDYDPEMFTLDLNSAEHKMNDFILDKYVLDYYDIFSQLYDGKYTEEDFLKLTENNFSAQSAATGFMPFSWKMYPKTDYMREMTIEPYEQINFSNTMTDEGVVTVAFGQQNTIAGVQSLNNENLYKSVAVSQRGLIPLLGARVIRFEPSCFVDTPEGVEIYNALKIRRNNAEMRNLSINTVPKFGVMVNRPMFWRYRNYYSNVVSSQHSIVWNSDCSSTININSVRGWTGRVDTSGKEEHEHFGGKQAFRPVEFVQKAMFKVKEASGKGDK